MKKSSALALAIAGTLAAPAVLAEVYVSARLGVDMVTSDDAADESLTFGNMSSRIGWKGETDLGNGMTAFGKLEVGNLDAEATNGFALRDLHVGLAADWGKIIVGERVYTAFYNHVTGPLDPTYWQPGTGFVQSGRTNQAITYQGGGGIFSFEVTAEADGTDSTNTPSEGNTGISGYQAGASIALGDNWTIALAGRNAEDSANSPTDKTATGATVYGSLGNFWLGASLQQDDDDTGTALMAKFGNYFLGYSTMKDDSADTTVANTSIGGEWPIGENTSFWAEYGSFDSDGAGKDSTELAAALVVNF
jgi:predicted porin